MSEEPNSHLTINEPHVLTTNFPGVEIPNFSTDFIKERLPVQVKVLDERIGNTIEFPSYATDGSAGIDLRACIDNPLTIQPGSVELIKTGLAIQLPSDEYASIILPRSGLGHKKGIVLGNLVGLVDADYQEEVMISCWNRSNEAYTIEIGERIAQLVIIPVLQANFTIVKDFDKTRQRSGGFGHSGRF